MEGNGRNKSYLKIIYWLACVLCTILCGTSYADNLTAQQNQIIRSSTEPGRVTQQLTSPMPPSELAARHKIQFGAEGKKLAPEAAAVKFQLSQIKLVGNSVYSENELLAPYRSRYGQLVSLGEIEDIARAITHYYQAAGYVLTRVVLPPQRITQGVITLQVIEGFIEQVQVVGNIDEKLKTLLLRYAQSIRQSRPLQIKVLERYSLLANDLPGVKIKVVLRASKTKIGAADMLLIAEQSNLSGYITYDNHGTRFLGPKQLTLSGNLNSAFHAGDTTGAQFVTTGNREVNFVQLTREDPIGINGLKLDLTAGYTRTIPGSYLEPFDIKGTSVNASSNLLFPIIRTRNENLYISGGIGIINSKTDVLEENLYDDRLRFLNFGFNYNRLDNWFGQNQIDFTMTQGLKVLGATSGGDTASRLGTKASYSKFVMDISRLQGLPKNFSLLFAASGQYTPTPLVAAEQFGVGGIQYGRGYDPSEITGDRGLAGKLELRYDRSPVQYYSFYDIGSVWNINTTQQAGSQSAASAGLGLRIYITQWLAGNIEFAQPLTKKVDSEGGRHPSIYFGVTLAGDK